MKIEYETQWLSHQRINNLVAFIVGKSEEISEMRIEKYTNCKGETWVRIKFMDATRTEVIMPEEEFEKRYGKVDWGISKNNV